MNKRRIIPLVILLLLITPFLGLVNIPPVQAAVFWWNHDWHHRAPINITGSTVGDLTNYPVQFNLLAGSGACSGNDIYMNGTAQADYDDIRFIADDQITLYEYWLVDNYTWVYPNTTVWVNVTSIPISPNVTRIWAYWNNDEASSLSNGTAVFPFFDDLLTDPDTNADWIVVEGTAGFVSHHGWYVRVQETAGVNGWSYIKGDKDLILSGASETYGWSMEWDQAISSNAADENFNYWGAGLANDLSHEVMAFDKLYKGVSWYWHSSNPFPTRYFYYMEWNAVGNIVQSDPSGYPWTYKTGTGLPPAGWSRYKMTLFTDSSYVTQNGTQLRNFDSLSANYLGVGQNPSYSGHGKSGDHNVIHGYVNWVFMRPLADPEPTPTVGSSESVVTDAGIHNMDGCGAWVHEGRTQYIFHINASSAADVGGEISVGMGFYDDAGDWYSFYYNNETGRITLVSPDDGISASLRDVETGDTWVSVNFTVIFKPNVADTLDVDLYARYDIPSIGDSGWYVYSADYFNIYNEGGFATLTASGYAGRTTGGDVFEIYAADKSTPILIPFQDFKVQKSPLDPGWKEFGVWIVRPASEEHLIDKLTGWDFWITERLPNTTITVTNRGPTGVDEAYYSYPFSLRIQANPIHLDVIAERPFRRLVTPTTDEIVYVQVFAMTPQTTGTTGNIRVTDTGPIEWLDSHKIFTYLTAVDLEFTGNGSILLGDGPDDIYPATYTGNTWYNFTFVINCTAQNFDFYVDDVLKASDVDFRSIIGGADSVGVLVLNDVYPLVGTNYTDFYVDDVEVKTDFSGDYGGDAKATVLYNYLPHWSVDWDFKIEQGRRYVLLPYANSGFIEFGMDVCINETWEDNFLVARINITDGIVNIRNNYVEFNVTWYQNGTYQKHDILYGLFEGYYTGDAPGAKDTTRWYFDMWFDRTKGTVGGRLNTKYFGTSDVSEWHKFWVTEWGPMFSDVTESKCHVTLNDTSDVIHSIKEVSLIRPWVRVYRTDDWTFHYAIANTETEFPTTKETMSGINTPPIKATVIPTMQAAGLGVFIAAMLKHTFGDLIDRLPTIGAVVVGLIDFLGGFIGYPKVMSNMSSWVGNAWGYFVTILSEMFLFQLIGLVFGVVTSIFGHLIWWLTSMITIFTDIFTIVWAIWDGTYTGVGVLQDMWALMNWPVLVEAMPIFIAIAWLDSIDKRYKAAGRQGWFGFMFGDIKNLMDITSFIAFLAGKIYDWTVNTITRIMLILKR